MNFLAQIFNTILYQPLFNALIFFYNYLPGHDFGLAVIFLTLIIKIILFPSSMAAIKSQLALARLQPKIKQIQEKYKGDRVKQSQAMMEIYQKEKINPFSGCLPLLLQLPILIALYQVFLKGFSGEILQQNLYSFVSNPGVVVPTFLGVLNLAQPNIYLAILAGVLQYFQIKLSTKQQGRSKASKGSLGNIQNQMLYLFPVLAVFIIWKLGAVVGLYWVTTTFFAIGEQVFVAKKYHQKHERAQTNP